MSTAKMRMGKLFNKETGRAFVVAFDHGQALPIPEGLGNPIDVMKRLSLIHI